MWKRIVWDVLCVTMVFMAPWWVVLIMGIIGIIFFPWYLEIIFLGAMIDGLFGTRSDSFLMSLLHTGIFTLPLIIIIPSKQLVRSR